ncbi:MAG: hypothetical protein J6X44_01910, partial [Thermoguttaceae bacterium]|nr:hypothetical protein [Thermoguttaceae bacterium]
RHIAAQLFLGAGFETVPADDEDVQTALAMFSAAYSENPPDEIVFALGMPTEPAYLTRSLAGRVSLTLLRFSGAVENATVSRSFQRSLCQTLDVRELFKKHGFDWDAHESATWDVWSDRIDMLLSGAFEPRPASSAPTPTPEPVAPESEQVDVPSAGQRVVVGYEEAIRRENVEKFTELAPQWNEAILEYLAERNHRRPVFEIAQTLDERFPGLCNFSMKYRDEFRDLLCDSLHLLVEDAGIMYLYDSEHPDFRPDPDALAKLDVGSQAAREEPTYANQTNRPPIPAETFAEISRHAGLSRDYCAALADRKEDPENSPFFETINDDFVARGKEIQLTLWQGRGSLAHDVRIMRALAESYDLLEQTTSYFDLVVENAAELPHGLVVRACQLVASAQCFLKTRLNDVGVSLGVDQPQREAFFLLRRFLDRFDVGRVLKHLHRDEFVDQDIRDELLEECQATREETIALVERGKARKKAWGYLEYQIESLKESPSEDAIGRWNKIVETTTRLCDELDEPYSSARLRELLKEIVGSVPEEIETTDAFCYVVQEIDEYVENERAQAEVAFQQNAGPVEPSSELLTARRRYAGSKLVFIGGAPQEHLRKRLEKAFQAEVEWPCFDHGDSLDRFGPYLRDPNVKLFVVYIPWCSHKHSEELVALIKEADKDYVRQRKGTNPEVIAHSICQQLSLLE